MVRKTQEQSVGSWRRMASFWIDIFVIYSLTRFIITLLALTKINIAFGTLFILIGACYSTVMLSNQKQTIGHMLLRIQLSNQSGQSVHTRQIVLRELFGKWILTFALPLLIGSALIGDRWLPTIHDLIVLLIIAALGFVYLLITRRLWYDHLSGLKMIRTRQTYKVKRGFYGLLIVAAAGIGTGSAEYLTTGRLPCRMAAFQNMDSSKPFVKFLEKQATDPVDYVLSLFDTYDVVVLCERGHPEMRQWDFIYEIVQDPRFINKVGHIYTEIGQIGMQDYLNEFMLTDVLGASEIQERSLHIMRNAGVWPESTNFNLYQYFQRLYGLNQTLSPENRVEHHFTDAELDWSAIATKTAYKEYWDKFVMHRDEFMANSVIEQIETLSLQSEIPSKGLVIMNYRHAMDLTDGLAHVEKNNTFEFIKAHFGNKAANVLINNRVVSSIPVASGVWDRAFEKNGNRRLGFNLQGNPFGNSFFDMFPFYMIINPFDTSNTPSTNGSLRYRDVFTGYVFTHPTKEQYFQTYYPGYFDGFEEEYIRRTACISESYKEKATLKIQSLKKGSPSQSTKPFDFKIETRIALSFFGLAFIGLIIGLIAFLSRPKKMNGS